MKKVLLTMISAAMLFSCTNETAKVSKTSDLSEAKALKIL